MELKMNINMSKAALTIQQRRKYKIFEGGIDPPEQRQFFESGHLRLAIPSPVEFANLLFILFLLLLLFLSSHKINR
jgi:hypothetical protein